LLLTSQLLSTKKMITMHVTALLVFFLLNYSRHNSSQP
jgi:hypothetical protein